MERVILSELNSIKDILLHFPEALWKTFTDINFSNTHNIVFGIILTFLSFFIFFKANHIYSKTFDKRILLLGTGIGIAGLFEIFHFINSQNKYLLFYYIFFENLANTFAFLLPISYMTKPYLEKKDNFRLKTLLYFSLGFLTTLFFQIILPENYLIKIFTYPSLEIIYSSIFFLSAIIYTAIRHENGLRPFSLLTLGIIFLALSEIYVPIGGYFTSIYRYWVHILNLLSLICILFGIKDLQINVKMISLKQKFILYPPLIIILLYFILIIAASSILSFEIPPVIDYFFLLFFIFTVIALYFLALKLTLPIENVIHGIKKFNAENKPEEIAIISNDELGELTNEFNKNANTIWKNQNEMKELIDRERLIKEIIQSTKQTLEFNELLKIIAEELSEKFNVQRVSVNKFIYDENHTFSNWQLMYEYRSRPEIKSVIGLPYFKEETDILAKIIIGKGIFFIENMDTFKIGAPKAFISNFETLQIKSLILVSIGRGKEIWGTFGMSDVDNVRTWDEKTIELLLLISDQIYIAIKQAELYTQIKQKQEREKLISDIIGSIRISIDFNEVKSKIVNEIGKVINADRCFIIEYNPEKDIFIPVKNEYLSSPNIKSCIGLDIEKRFNSLKEIIKKGYTVKGTTTEFINKYNYTNTDIEDFFEIFQVKSGLGISIFYINQLLGALIIHYTEENKQINDEEVQLVKILTDQISIVLYQAKLYDTVKFNAEKEKFLKELIGKIKRTQKIDEIFEIVFPEIFNLFDINRAIYIEIPPYKYQKPIIKQEQVKDNINLLSKITDYNTNLNSLIDMLSVNKKVIIKNLSDLKPENTNWSEFTKEYDINSLISVPLISQKENIELIGVIALFSNKVINWKEEEISLLEGIANIIAGMIWDITKREEIEELKTNLVLTLANKLQEPLCDEEKIFQFLLNQDDMINYQSLLNELIFKNKNMYKVLGKLIDIYSYESNKHFQTLNKGNINSSINEVLKSFEEKIKTKNLTIELQLDETLQETLFEEKEIQKVINCYLDNAINAVPKKGTIIIKSYSENKNIIVCIIDNGPGISDTIKELIFEKQLATILSNKETSSGLSLYLSKLIIQAHKGETWFYTDVNTGSTFCFSLPII